AFRSATTMPAAPSAAKRIAAARPMPLAAPVTTATLPFKSMSGALSRPHRVGDRGLLAELHLGDRVAVNLIGPVGEAQRARMRIGGRKTEVLADAAAAVHLHRPVDHLAGNVRREHLDHRDLLLRDLVSDRVHLPG